MPAVTPGQLLKVLQPLLNDSGGMQDVESSMRIVSLMKDATKMVSKCMYVNICLNTASEEVLQKFISGGGWNMLSQWLQDAKDDDNIVFIIELLKVYQCLPVSIEVLKQDNTARFIKGLTKHSDEEVKTLSGTVVDSWMKKIKNKSNGDNDNDKAKKKKKKDKDREKDHDKDKEKDKQKEQDKDKEKDKQKEQDKDRAKDKEREKDKEKDKDRHRHRSSDKKDSSHHSHSSKSHHHSSKKDSSSSEKKASHTSTDSAHKDRHASSDSKEDNSENAEARLAGDADVTLNKSPSSSKPSSVKEEDDEKMKRKPKTARVFTSKFRSVFDEDDPTPLPPVKKKTGDELKAHLPLPKRTAIETMREEPPEKIPRLTLKIIPSDHSDSLTSPTDSAPEVTHGRIKIIPPKRPPAHEIHDSNVFMNELTKSSYMHGTIKRKKKATALPPTFPSSKEPTAAAALKTPSSATPSTPTTPTTPPSTISLSPGPPVSPLTPPPHKLPCVPSFYRDTLETSEDPEPAPSREERSPPSLEKMDTSEPDEAMAVDEQALEHSEPPTIDMETSEAPAQEEAGDLNTSATSEGGEETKEKGDSAEGSPEMMERENQDANGKNGKKRVRWAEESRLRQVFYFELDETERENVNRPKTFNELKKQDMRSEGRAMETAKRLINDNMVEVLPWRRPPMIDNITMAVEPGCNSTEKGIQQQRELGVLQALFFSKQMLPDSPIEPDLESVEPTDIKIIPLVDETCSGEEYEHTYNVDPANMPYDPAFDISQNMNNPNHIGGGGPGVSGGEGGGGGGGGGGKGGIQLPPDINNMLASIQQQSIATGGRSLQANSAVMANVQSILSAIMHSGPNANTEELINKLRVALDPLKNQISSGPMPGPMNPNDAQFQPPPQAPQRHGLLGNAPPGFNPMMGPRQFGPQGPMMGGGGGGGMDGDWNTMGGMGNMQGGPDMGMRGGGGPMGPGFHPMQGPGGMPGPPPGPNMGGGGPVMQGPRMRKNQNMMRGPDGRFVCRHFVAPSGCRFGNACAFLHPGVNGPALH